MHARLDHAAVIDAGADRIERGTRLADKRISIVGKVIHRPQELANATGLADRHDATLELTMLHGLQHARGFHQPVIEQVGT